MQNPPPVQTAKSSTGLDENIAALLAYVFTWVSGLILFIMEKNSRLVKFHAMQSILLAATAIVCGVVLWIGWFVVTLILAQILDFLGTIVGLLLGLLIGVFFLAIVVAWVICLVKATDEIFSRTPIAIRTGPHQVSCF